MPGLADRWWGRRCTLAAVFAVALVVALGGCTQTTPAPGASSAATQSATDSLDLNIQHFMDGRATSFVVQVRWPGGEWSKAYGVRNLDTKAPALPQDRVSVGSITKSMVAVSVLKLVDEGLVGLDDPVNGVLESFQSTLHPPGPITVRQLLSHTSGMPDFGDSEYATGPTKQVVNTRLSMQRALELAATLPWELRRVDTYSYSSSNYMALGQLIEKLRGRPIGEVLKRDIFDPLGLQHTSLAEPDRSAPDNLHAYVIDGNERLDVTQSELLVGPPAGGVISTTQNVNTFFRALLRGQLLSPASLAQMKTKPATYGYGLGLRQFRDGCSSNNRYGHLGSVYGYLTTSITTADGGSQVTMTMSTPPLPSKDEGAGRRIELLEEQMEWAAQETLDRLCQ
ncbi:serine hydrolase domain-containing protein [Arthrobacter sp. MMS24-S77]